jgi:1,4-alpha-glucan branching enzyme
MFAFPGKKLLFMGGEFGQWREWNHDESLDWNLLNYPPNLGLQKWVEDLNRVYRTERALFEMDFDPSGFSWIDANDFENSTYSLLRWGRMPGEVILAVFNFTPILRLNYRVGAPYGGEWKEILNSDAK